MIKIVSPIDIYINKNYHLNLNNYRNWHYLVSNSVKKEYTELLVRQLRGLKMKTPVEITFILYKPSKRKIDRSNVLSIVEKFFCDALVHYGCIPDDDDKHIVSTHYSTGGIDKYNPRVEIYIKTKEWSQK